MGRRYESLLLPAPRGHVDVATEQELQMYESSLGFDLPADAREFLLGCSQRAMLGFLLAGEDLDHRELGQVVDVRDPVLYPVEDVFFHWTKESNVLAADAADWAPFLVQIVSGSSGAFYYDFSFDRCEPSFVYVDGGWDAFEVATRGSFRGVQYVAESLTSAIGNRHVMEYGDEPPGPFNEEQHAAWLSHRDRMLGLAR